MGIAEKGKFIRKLFSSKKQTKKTITLKKIENSLKELFDCEQSNCFSGLKDWKELNISHYDWYWDFFEKLKNNDTFEVLANDYKYLEESVPNYFWKDNYYYIHYNDIFAKVEKVSDNFFKISKLSTRPKEVIYDLSTHTHNFKTEISFAINRLKEVIEREIEEHTYNPHRYIKTVIEEKEIPNERYSRNYSLSAEDEKKMEAWKQEHFKNIHNSKLRYTGAIGVSRFYVKFIDTSIGTACDCICEECEKLYKQETDTAKKDELYKQMCYTIEELG